MKFNCGRLKAKMPQSPPARGAWIEIPYSPSPRPSRQVAPREGGVD